MENMENILNSFPNHDNLVLGEPKSCLKSGTAEDRGLPEGHDQTEASLEKKTVTFIDDVHVNKIDNTNATSPNLETQNKYGACDAQGASDSNCSSHSSTVCCQGSTTSDKAEIFSESHLSSGKGSGACDSTDCTASESLSVTSESNVQSEGTASEQCSLEENPSKKEVVECLPTKTEKQVTFAEDVEVVVPEDANKLAEEAPPKHEQGESHDCCHVTLPSHCQEGLDTKDSFDTPAVVGLMEMSGSERPAKASEVTGNEREGGQTEAGSPEMTRAVEDAVLKLLASSETKPAKEDTGDDSSDDVSALLTKDKAGQNREPSADGGRTLQDFLRNYDVTSELGWSEGPDHFHHDLDAKDLDNMGDDSPEEELRHLLGPDVDRGWAWVVLVLSYLGMTIYGTFAFSTGIFQAEILAAIEPDIQKTAWVGATHLCVISLSGPFASVMRDYIGSRRTILVASVIICVGMVGASFSRTVAHLIVTYGLVTGLGMGMALNPIFVSSGYYFVRYRGIASGVVAAGSSTGMFVGGPIIRSLLDSYGLGGTYLIMGAIGLQLAVVGMVMRPSSMEQKREEGGRMVLEKNWKMDSIMLASASTLPSVGGLGNVLGASTFNMLRDKDAQSETQKSQLLYGIPEDKVVNYHVPEVNVTPAEVQDTHSRLDWQSRQRLYSQCSYVSSIENVSTRGRLYSSYILRDIGRPLSRSSLSIRTDDRSPEGATCCQFNCSCLDAFRILKNPAFLLYMFSCFMWYFGEAAVFTYLPSYAISEGTPPIEAALLITVMGAGSIVSRLVTGFVAGDSSVGPELMHIGLLGLIGALTVTLPLYASTTSGQFVFSGLFGLYAGGLVSSINIIIIQLIGVDNIALGFGFISFSFGVGCLAGPVLAGVIVGTTGNYGHVYFFCGTLLLVGCLSGCPIVMFKPRLPDHDALGYFRKRGSIRSGSQVVSDDGVRSLV